MISCSPSACAEIIKKNGCVVDLWVPWGVCSQSCLGARAGMRIDGAASIAFFLLGRFFFTRARACGHVMSARVSTHRCMRMPTPVSVHRRSRLGRSSSGPSMVDRMFYGMFDGMFHLMFYRIFHRVFHRMFRRRSRLGRSSSGQRLGAATRHAGMTNRFIMPATMEVITMSAITL